MRHAFRRVAAWIATPRVPGWIAFGAKLILGPLSLLTLVALAMQLGVWRKHIDIAGPFAAETNPPQHSLIVTVPDEGRVPWWRQPLNHDNLEKPFESRLRLQIDGRETGPAHSSPQLIREGKTTGYSHWDAGAIFSLPPSVSNSHETVITLSYSIQPRPWVTLAMLLATLSLGWLVFHAIIEELARRQWQPASPLRQSVEWLAVLLLPLPYLILFGLGCLGLMGMLVFAGSSVYALANGWALPTTAPIRWFSIAEWAARNEPYLGQMLVTLAGFGTVTTWLSSLCNRGEQSLAYELRLRKLLCRCGFPIAACAFILSVSAMWAGLVRAGDPHWANIGGLVPYNDAHGHLSYAYYQARDGSWAEFAARRPLAAAFREVLLFFSDYSFAITLLLQGCLLAFATCVASYAVMIWRGVWAALAFFGFAYIYARVFAATSLTEPLGLFWALLSIRFFVESFSTGSVKSALVGFAMMATALMTRMGSMFTVPALLLWLILQLADRIKSKARVAFLATSILIAVFGTNFLLQKAYGSPGAGTGSNFAYTLCGLTIGTTWDGCLAKLAEQGRPLHGDNEADIAKQLYAFAWENFRAHPAVFFARLKGGAIAFVTDFSTVMWRGYDLDLGEATWLPRQILMVISIAGLAYVFLRKAQASELTFWALFWISIIASSAIVYYDDGARVLAASQPLIALFFAIGLGDPQLAVEDSSDDRQLSLYGLSSLVLATTLFVSVPWVAHHIYRGEHSRAPKSAADEAVVFGSRKMSGFLVVGDGKPLRGDIASVHLSDFKAMVTQAGIYETLAQPITPTTPFGLVFAPRLESAVVGPSIFFVPPKVLEHAETKMWDLQYGATPGTPALWPIVTKAEPLSP